MKTKQNTRQINTTVRLSFLVLLFLYSAYTAQAQISLTLTPVTGNCLSDCEINASAWGTTGAVTYSLINYPVAGVNSSPQASGAFTGLLPGTYTVGVYDATTAGVPVTQSVTVTTRYNQLTARQPATSYNSSNRCSDNGTLTINFTGGMSPYRIKITNTTYGYYQEEYYTTSSTHPSGNVSYRFQSLSSGDYIFEIEDACGQIVQNVPGTYTTVTSRSYINLSGQTFTSIETNGGYLTYNGSCADVTITPRVTVYLNNSTSSITPGGGVQWRLEYPAYSGNYSDWTPGSYFNLTNFNRNQTNGNKFRVQVEHPCTGAVITSPVFTIDANPYFEAVVYPNVVNSCPQMNLDIQNQWKTVGPDSVIVVNGCVSYTVVLRNSSNTVVGTQTIPVTSEQYVNVSFPNLSSGTYRATITGTGFSQTINNIVIDQVNPLVKFYTHNRYGLCDYSTTSISAQIDNISVSDEIYVTFTIEATGTTPAITRQPVTLSMYYGQLWTDIPGGTYKITAIGDCSINVTQSINIPQQYVAGFTVDSVTYDDSPYVVCGINDIVGAAHFYNTNGTKITSTGDDYIYWMLIVDGPSKVGTRVFGYSGRTTRIADLPGGTYTVMFYPYNTPASNQYVDKYGHNVDAYPTTMYPCYQEATIYVPEYFRPVVNIPLSGGITCQGSPLTTLTINTLQGNKPPFQYRYKFKYDSDYYYSSFQTDNVFYNVWNGEYTVQIQDDCGTITTQEVKVYDGNEQFVGIIGEVLPGTVCETREVTLSVLTIGPVQSYQWYYRKNSSSSWTTLPSTSATYVIPSANQTHKGQYMVEIYNGLCSLQSDIEIIDVLSPSPRPSISGDGNVICVGGGTMLTANTTVYSPTFQWYRNGQPVGSNSYYPYYTATEAGSYTVVVTPSSECPSDPSPAYVVTVREPEPPLASDVSADDVCNSGYPVIHLATSLSGATYNVYTESSGGWNVGYASGTGSAIDITLSDTPSSDVTYYIEMTISSCNSASRTPVTVTVVSTPSPPSVNSVASMCAGATFSINVLYPDPGYYYTVYDAQYGGNLAGQSATGSGTISGLTAPSSSTTYYVATALSAGCESDRTPVAITINPAAISTDINADDAEICSGNAATLTAYAPYVSSPSFLWYASNWTTDPPLYTTQTCYPAPSTTTTYYVSVSGTNYCENVPGDRRPVTVTVAANMSGGTIGSDQTVCYNDIPATLTSVYGASGGTGTASYSWQYSTNNGSSWSTVNHNSATYAPSALTQTTLYRRAYTTDCGTVHSSNTVTVTVVANMSGGTIGSNQTICYNDTPAGLTSPADASGGKGSTSYSWEYSTDNGSSWSTVYHNYATYYPPSLTQTTQYRRLYTTDCGTVRSSNTVTITVSNDMSGGEIGSDQTVCYNSIPAPLTSVSGASGGKGSTYYSWIYSTDNGSSWLSLSHNSATYTPPALTQTTLYRRAYTSDCGTVYSNNTITVTVAENMSGGTIGSDQTICYNDTPAGLTSPADASGGKGSTSYSWEYSTDNGSSWSTVYHNYATYYPPSLTQTTRYRRTYTTDCGTVYSSNTVTITVAADMSGGEIGSDQTICYNAVPATLTSVTNASGGKGTASYSWQYSTNNGYSWSTVNHNSATYTPPALTQTRQYRRAYTTDCGTVYSDPVTITVAGYTNGGEIGSDQTICYNTAPAALTSVSGASGGTGTIYYTWEYSTDGYSWSSVNHNSATYQPSAITQTTLYRRVYNTGCGTVYSYNTITVTVVEDMSGGTIGSDQTICYNEVPALLTSPVDASGGKGTTSYSWEYSTDNGSSWSTDYYNSSIYQPSALTQTTQYRRAYTSDCGTVRSDPVTITVAADMYGGTIGSDQTICYNTAPATLTSPADAGGGKGATSYSWEYSTDNGSSWVSVNHNYATYTPPAITQTTLYRRIYASDCGTVYSVNTVTVSLDAAGATIIADTVKICDGSSAELKASAPGVINPVFRWYETQTSTTPSGSGETFTTPALSTVTLVKYYVSVSGTNYCENVAGSRKEVVVIVNQYATFQQPNAILSSICAGNDPRPLTLNPTTIWGVINPIIRWYSDQTSQTPFHIGNMYMVPTLTDTTRYYISIETTNYCETLPGSRFQITIPVLQHIAASQIEASDISICYGGRGELTASAPGITNPAFMWYESQTSTEVLHSGTTFKTPSLTATTKYYVSATGLNLCENVPGDRKEVTVTVTGSSAFVDDVWYYGMNGEGIRFANSGNVHTAQDASGESKVRSHENSLVVSSPYCDGQNIFYASHNKLYNSLHEPMTNGDFTGNSSVADGLAACYMGDNKYLFFSVTNSYENGNRGLKAYTVDMNADHGKGEIVGSIDIEAASANMSESIELLTSDVLHKYWLIYAYKDGSYYHLRVREVDATDPEHPAINASVHNSITTSTMQHTYTLKSSPQHNRIAIANSDDKTVDVFDFNSTTGVLSNLRTTPVAANQRIDGLAYGVEFSPDGKQLYAAGYATGGGGAPVLCQYTITPTGLDFVERVQYWTVSNSYTSRGGGLKLGPDGRIYVMLAYDKYAGVISDADSTKTLSSRYDPTGMELNVDPSSYGLQFSTGLTRPSEMACNDNIPPATVTDETQFCITATSRTGKFNVLKNDPADGNSDRVYLTGANFKTLSDTVLAKITVNAADSTISLTIKSGVYLSTTGYVFDIVYHVKDDGSPASQCAAGTLKMTVYPTLSFADMRVRVCPGVTEVNLAKYIDTTVNVSTIKWGGIMSGAISSAGIIPVSSLLHTRVHTFTYTVNSYCTGEQTRKFYLEILKNKRSLLPKDTVVICHKYAEAIQIDQLFGIEGGTLSYPASPYIVKSSSGATVMNGKALYENDHSDVYRGESGFRIITFTYKPDAGNCLPVAEYRITIVLTG